MANNQGQQNRAQILQARRFYIFSRKNQLIDQFKELIAEDALIDAELVSIQAEQPKLIAKSTFLPVKEVGDGKAD